MAAEQSGNRLDTAAGQEVEDAHVLAQLRGLGTHLLKLAELGRRAQPQNMLEDAMGILRGMLPFDSAWWGEVSAPPHEAPRNWLHGSIGLSKTFAEEWNTVSMCDAFALQSMAELGQAIRHSDAIDPMPQTLEVAAFSQRHGLFHCMAVTVELPHSGLLFFVSLYRQHAKAAFSGQEAVLLEAFTSHLVPQWVHTLAQLHNAATHCPLDSHALVDQAGNMLFLGIRLGQVLATAFPAWSGTQLPTELLGALGKTPCNFTIEKSHRLRLEPCGSLVAISLPAGRQRSPLSPRELGVAMLYAGGHSNKQIAASLGLTPATVRTYLRSVYVLLGVQNKVELATALRH